MSLVQARYRERFLRRQSVKPSRILQKYLLTKIINPSIREFIKGEKFTGYEFKKILDTKIRKYSIQAGFVGYLRKLRKRKMRQYGFSFLERINYFKLSQKSLVKASRRKRPKAYKSPHDIVIKDPKVLDDFVLSKNKKNYLKEMVDDLSYTDQNMGLKNLKSLNNLPERLQKKLDKYLDSIKEEKLQKLSLREQRRLLNKSIKGLGRLDSVNYSKFLVDNEVRNVIGKAEELGLKTIKHEKSFKVWQSYFDFRVRPWHETMDGKTIEKHKLFRVVHPRGIDYIPAPRVGNISPANLFNCRCYLRYEFYPKTK